MKNSKNELEQGLENAIKLAEKYELQLPHVSDCIYASVRLIRNYEENMNRSIKALIKANKQIKYMKKFLKKTERKQVKAYMEGLYDSK